MRATTRSLLILSALLLLPTLHAHFLITTFTPLGTGQDDSSAAPCGGYSISPSSTVSDFPVNGAAVGVRTSHPEANILIRGTLDTTGRGNWTALFPVVGQYGLGFFCLPQVLAPTEWVGQSGLVQVVQSAVDGLLFQCAAVKFVDGVGTLDSSKCQNGTGVTGSFTTDARLPSSNGTNSPSGSSTSASAPSATSAGPQTTSSPSSAGRSSILQGTIVQAGMMLAVVLLL